MRFLHAADIHLDSPLAGMTRRDPELGRLTATCTRAALSNLVDAAIAHDVAFLLIAGDLYDTEQRNYETGLFFANEMRRLGRPCIMIHGNHDSAAAITKSLQPPPNVHVLPSRRPDRVALPEHGVVIHGQSFAAQAETEDLAARYPDPVPGAFNIGLLHSSVEDPGEHARYAPCRLETLVNKNYGYWALGHIHTTAVLHEHPFVHFPGNTQGRHIRETGPRGATLVEVSGDRVRSLTQLSTDVLRWAVLRLDVGGMDGMAQLVALVRFELARARGTAEGRPLIARIVLAGATPLHAFLLSNPEAIDAECRAAAEATGHDVHIERVKLQTRAPEAAADFGALQDAVRAALADPDLVSALLRDFSRLDAVMPAGATRDVPRTETELADLQDDAWSIIRHAIEGGPGAGPSAGPGAGPGA